MSFVVLDLEWNGSYSKALHRFVNEIIEFGAVKVDDEFNIIDTFSVLIKPQIGKKLSGKVQELTKITNEELFEKGIPFLDAVNKFTRFSEGSVLMTWSTSDIHALIENYSYFTGDCRLPFLKKYCNLQAYCENCLDQSKSSAQLGLSTCAELLGIEFSQETQHRAFSDAELSLKCLKKLRDKKPLDGFIVDSEKSNFYEKIIYKTRFITDINSDEIDKKQMRFKCDVCGRRARRTSKWKLHNKSFSAEFFCKHCSRAFIGRISFKKKFDDVTVKKRIVEKRDKKQQHNNDAVYKTIVLDTQKDRST